MVVYLLLRRTLIPTFLFDKRERIHTHTHTHFTSLVGKVTRPVVGDERKIKHAVLMCYR